MLGKIINGNLITARGKVLKYKPLNKVIVPETVTDESGEETIIEKEVIQEGSEVIVANPREEDFIKAGYKEVVDGERLEEKEGFYQVPVYTEEDDKIITTYEYKEVSEDDSL